MVKLISSASDSPGKQINGFYQKDHQWQQESQPSGVPCTLSTRLPINMCFDSLCSDIWVFCAFCYFIKNMLNKVCVYVCVFLLLCINYPLLEEHHASGNCICNQDETEVHWEKREKAPQWDFYHPKISWHCIHLWWGRVLIRSSILGIPWAAAKVLTDLSPKTDVFYTPTPLQLFNFSMPPVFLCFSLHFGG